MKRGKEGGRSLSNNDFLTCRCDKSREIRLDRRSGLYREVRVSWFLQVRNDINSVRETPTPIPPVVDAGEKVGSVRTKLTVQYQRFEPTAILRLNVVLVPSLHCLVFA